MKFHCPVLMTAEKTLEELIYKDGVKIMAITDKALAEAIENNKETVFTDVIQE